MVLASLRIRRKRTLPSGVSSVFKRVVDFAAAHQWLRRRPQRLLNRRSKQDRRRQWWGRGAAGMMEAGQELPSWQCWPPYWPISVSIRANLELYAKAA